MKGRLALLCFAILGCGGDDAVGIEIRVPDSLDGVDTVELVLGVGPCLGDCAGVAPPVSDPPSPGRTEFPAEVYAIDAEALVAPVSGGVARFSLASQARTLPATIAVGTGNGQLGTVILDEIDLGAARTHVAELVVAGDTLDETLAATNVERWESGASRCIGAEVADTGRRVFIVPEEDPDCDAVATECEPFVHLATEAASTVEVGALACSSTGTVGDNTESSCLLGAPICDELAPDSAGCANASEVCVSDHVCACAAFDATCLQTVYAVDAIPTMIQCSMEVVDNGGATFSPCVPQSLIGPSLAQGGTCASTLTIGPVGLPLAFETSHTVALAASQFSFTVHDPTGVECRMQIDWAGSFDAVSGVQKIATLVKLDVSSTRSVILPLVIDPVVVQGTNNCTGIAGNRCDLVQAQSDNVFDCVP